MSTEARPLHRYLTPLVAAIATVATLATIGPVFAGNAWITTSALVAIVIALGGIALRQIGIAQSYVSLCQLVIGLYALTLITSQPTMLAGFIPTGDTLGHIIDLVSAGATTARTEIAPISSTPGTEALLALLITPVAVLVDDCAITKRPALAGIPLLTLFAICSAIVRHPISMWLVVAPVMCYLTLLWISELPSSPRRRFALTATGLAATALVAALAVGVAAMVTAVVRLPDGGIFAVSGGNTRTPNESVARSTDLAGQLTRSTPLSLFSVKTDDPSPYYLRAVTLEDWGRDGWDYNGGQDDAPVDPAALPRGEGPSASITTHTEVTVNQYADQFVPTYYAPTSISIPNVQYDVGMSVAYVDDPEAMTGTTYSFDSAVPRPTSEELANVRQTDTGLPASVQNNLVVPTNVDPAVIALTEQVVGDAATPWDVAVALDGFFNDPSQGWVYTFDVPDPGNTDPLTSFLQQRQGFCEQYASAMAAMFRIADVPARVVIGYTKGTQQGDASYLITTDDAHAWVEAYFDGVGWVSFDPTPIGARSVPLPYVPSDQSATAPTTPTPSPSAASNVDELPSVSAAPSPEPEAAAAGGSDASAVAWLRWILVAIAAAALLSLPLAIRHLRWQRRLKLAGTGTRDGALAAWAELREVAAALGSLTRPNLSESTQARAWAADLKVAPDDLSAVGLSVERARYADESALQPTAPDLITARQTIREKVGERRWWRAMALPRRGWK